MGRFRYLPLILLIHLSLSGCPAAELQGVPRHDQRRTAEKQEKLDPSLLIEVNRLTSQREADREIDVLIRTRGPVDPSRRAEIEKRGGRVGSTLGDISTARVPAGRMEDVAQLEFVIFIEKAKRLQPK